MSKTAVAFATVFGIFFLAFLLLVSLMSFGWLDINWPWENVDLVDEETTIQVDVANQGPAEITKVTPISLDCRARIKAEVPVVGTQRTSVIGATVSTDTVRLRAVGDVDTCVSSDGVEIIERPDGTTIVIIEASAIRFERPRVDAIATMDSVTTDRGIVGQLVGALPWTNEDDELTPAAFAFAQTVIGGSACMQAAYEQTEAALASAYEDQLVAQGQPRTAVDVVISGTPNFAQNDVDLSVLGDFEFVEEQGTICVVADR